MGSKPIAFPEPVQEVSKTFVQIFNEAAEAEHRQLHNICGPGYRKALEHLIRDFVIKVLEVDAEVLNKKPLAACIREHLSDTKIKTTAKRAWWLGNDETHYTRTWAEQDINDLKALIRITANHIDTEMLTAHYEETMPDQVPRAT